MIELLTPLELFMRIPELDEERKAARKTARVARAAGKAWHESNRGVTPKDCLFDLTPKKFTRAQPSDYLEVFTLTKSELRGLKAALDLAPNDACSSRVIRCQYVLYPRYVYEYRVTNGASDPFLPATEQLTNLPPTCPILENSETFQGTLFFWITKIGCMSTRFLFTTTQELTEYGSSVSKSTK